MSQYYASKKNMEGSEPKKKLKKTRSIKLSKAPSLRSSSRRSKSRFSCGVDTSTANGLSDSASNYIIPDRFSDANKHIDQGGNENDDAISVSSSSYASFVNRLPVLNQANRIKKMLKNCGSSRPLGRREKSKAAPFPTVESSVSDTPQHPSCADGSQNYLKETSSSGGRKVRPQASPRNSESSFNSSDQSNTSAKTMMNKALTSTLKSSQICEDSSVDKSTCSSTLKDSKFPQRVEIHTGPTEAERISKEKVCPYHHCSLNGRSHSHDPPAKRALYKKRQPLKSQRSMKSVAVRESSSDVKFSGGRKKEIHITERNSKQEYMTEDDGIAITILTPQGDYKDKGFSIKIHAKSRAQFSIKAGGEVVEIFTGESSFREETQQESVNQLISSSPQIQDIMEICELQGTSEACGYDNSEECKLTSVISEVGSDVVGESNINDRLGEGEPSILNKDSEGSIVSSTALDCDVQGEFKTTGGLKNRNLDSGTTSITGRDQVQDSEKHSVLTRDSESSAPSKQGFGTQINKQRHISMWHMIQHHLASGLAAETEMKPIHREENEEMLEKDITPLPAATITDTTQSMSAENQDRIDQDIAIRQVFAIKLVRDAIEKILLPEVPDQSSDIQSVTSEAMSDHDYSESNFSEENVEDKQKESDQRKIEDKAAGDREELGHVSNLFRLEKKSDRRAPKHWSNLKKWIILQRFVKALEKVKQFNPKRPQHLELEPGPGAEKVSLRPQTVEERKRAQEWMLDYALRQAVSQLAPTQKKKVSLLVTAFETVKPPQGDSGVHLAFPKLKETSSNGASPHTVKIVDEPFSQGKVADSQLVNNKKHIIKLELKEESKGEEDANQLETHQNTSSSSNPEFGNASSGYGKANESSSIESSLSKQAGDVKSIVTSAICSASHTDTFVQQAAAQEERQREFRRRDVVLGEFDVDSKPNEHENEEEKRNYVRMWHMVYQHVVSSIAEKVGSRLLEGTDDEEAEDDNKMLEFSNGNETEGDEKSEIPQKGGFSKRDAIKLVQKAVDEIFLPEVQDDSSETQSVTSDTVQDQEISEKIHTEVGGQNMLNTPEMIKNDFSEEGSKEDKKAEPLVSDKSKLPKSKNWGKLRKLILLRRSVTALENARKLKPDPRKDLPLAADPEPEKVKLRPQMSDERNKAEQWMLDYEVQHIVNTLTPARKRRVAMLVEAFEAVVPLPEM